jgi:hypothetical protein
MKRILAIFSLIAISAGVFQFASAQDDEHPMGFFLTSRNIGNGADLGGLAGADAHCQMLASGVGVGDRTWRAYMSTSTVNARDRIGQGPWYNVRGELIAADIADLHEDNDNITTENSFTESGGRIPGLEDEANATHDMLTGTGSDGKLVLVQEGMAGIAEHETGDPATCNDWTGGDGRARVGHFDSQVGEGGTVWNSAHYTLGCSQEDLEKNASVGLFYCFAAD